MHDLHRTLQIQERHQEHDNKYKFFFKDIDINTSKFDMKFQHRTSRRIGPWRIALIIILRSVCE